MGEILNDGPWAGFEVIHTYTRQQAIEDGVLVDLTSTFPNETRMFKWNICCTDSVWSLIESAAEYDATDVAVYIWDVCNMALMAIRAVSDSGRPELFFKVCLPLRDNNTEKCLKLASGPVGPDDPSHCLTIMLPSED
jgi:hypothetical protein